MKKQFSLILVAIMCNACAILHHTQVSEIDSKAVLKGKKFEILLSETGINLQEAADIGKAMTSHEGTSDQIQAVRDIIALFQMGPRTGNNVYSEDYADRLWEIIRSECPRGNISGITSIRETNKYPVVSGEIVKIVGYCRKS